MGDFAADTALTGSDGRYRAVLSPDWEVWGPMGGYAAAIALRAMGMASELPRPSSFYCQFLSSARFAPVDVEVTTSRRGRRSHALQTRLVQGGKPVLTASAWFVANDLSGLEHLDASMPAVPAHEDLRRYAELADNYDEWYPVWRTIDGKPVQWSEEPRPPVWHTWMRLQRTPPLDDPVLDAARTLMWMDLMMWNAAVPPHLPWPLPYIAPNLDLAVVFHDAAPTDEWLLCDAHSPVARLGTVGCTGRVWSPSGRLLASGTSNLICLPNPELKAAEP